MVIAFQAFSAQVLKAANPARMDASHKVSRTVIAHPARLCWLEAAAPAPRSDQRSASVELVPTDREATELVRLVLKR